MVSRWLGDEINPKLDDVLLRMVDHHVGLPCPTQRDISQWTGLSRRRAWKYLQGMKERGILEMEVIEHRESGRDPKNRRLRRPGGAWTGWTNRIPKAAAA